jgi:hypothetical protein
MRKLIVSNFVTLDGLYEGKDKSINSLYDYYHADYADDHSFDFTTLNCCMPPISCC